MEIAQYLQKYARLVSREAVIRERFIWVLKNRYDVVIEPRQVSVGSRSVYTKQIPMATKSFIRSRSAEICVELNKNEFGFVVDTVG